MISKREAEEMGKRWEAATPGPWYVNGSGLVCSDQYSWTGYDPEVADGLRSSNAEANSNAIAHAREDHPATLAALNEAMEVLEADHDDGCPIYDPYGGGCRCSLADKRAALLAKWRGEEVGA